MFLVLIVQIQPISRKFNSCATDKWTDGRTDGQTNEHTLLKRCENASKKNNKNNNTDF